MVQIGVSSYSFSGLTGKNAITTFGMISKAKEMGFDIIEFAGLDVPAGEKAEAFAEGVREECIRVGIEMGNYTISADLLTGSQGDLDAEIERLKGEVQIARILGAPGMRHDATWGFGSSSRVAKGFSNALPRLVKGCKAVTEYAAEYGIRTMVENHGYFCQDSERVELLVNGVNHENFGILVDMGNFLCVDEDPAKAVGRLTPYAFHVHGKDFHTKPGTSPNPGRGWFMSRGGNYLRGSIIGHGDVPVQQCLKILKDAGYAGNISIEFEGLEEPLEAISMGLENLKSYLEG